jgi:hypothetical protein
MKGLSNGDAGTLVATSITSALTPVAQGWIVWALGGRVEIVAVSKRGRFESERAVRPDRDPGGRPHRGW